MGTRRQGREDAGMRGCGDAGTRECGDGYRVKGIQVNGLKYKLESLSGREGVQKGGLPPLRLANQNFN